MATFSSLIFVPNLPKYVLKTLDSFDSNYDCLGDQYFTGELNDLHLSRHFLGIYFDERSAQKVIKPGFCGTPLPVTSFSDLSIRI